MQTQQLTLSVICVFRNRKEWIEPTLKALYGIDRLACEFIFIDDGSTDSSTETIRSLIEYYQHDQTFFYEQEVPRGRGNSLNSAIEQSRGHVLWIPEHLHTVDQDLLSEAANELISSDSSVAIGTAEPPPETATDWFYLLQDNRLPFDRNCLFDLRKIREHRKFADPHWTTRHASEWAMRLQSETAPIHVKPFAQGDETSLKMDERSKKEGILTLLRVSGSSSSLSGSSSLQEKAFTMLRSFGDTAPGEDQEDTDDSGRKEQPPDHSGRETDSEAGEGARSSEPEPLVSSSGFDEEISNQPQVTIIIPTATNRRPVLEDCLTSVFRYTSRNRTRIIIVDNGSVDDTAEYLNRLLGDKLPLTVLSNDQNLGFAAAVNQGLAKAGDGIIIVMHNDVLLKNPLPARLAQILEKNPDIGLVSPKTDNTWNMLQEIGSSSAQAGDHSGTESTSAADKAGHIDEEDHSQSVLEENEFTEVDYVDGYCMAFRNQTGLTLSKNYQLAYFEDADFCYRIRNNGYRIVVANREQIIHHFGITTGDLGLTMRSKTYWKNAALFHKEWHIEPRFPAENIQDDPIDQFILMGRIINPFYPEQHLLDYFHQLFTSEQKTRVFHSEFPPDALKAMIRLMMAANQRDILRRLEQQLDSLSADIRLYHDLIAFYFDRTIYSRCKLYLDKLTDSGLPVDLSLYRLKIAIGEKDYEYAASLLQELMEVIPMHPELLMSAAQIHRRNGNHEQSEKFTALAKNFNPYIKS